VDPLKVALPLTHSANTLCRFLVPSLALRRGLSGTAQPPYPQNGVVRPWSAPLSVAPQDFGPEGGGG
jgi:hypothetical protein